ncbi:MAG TPA: hypothetical protein VNU47_03180 [Candidatus Paceibacterota bacterium]|nr:hypothetical protein [Candidatus Paceibacterota bacterium]
MAVQDFLLRQMIRAKMKDVPKEQQDQIVALVSKNPELFKKIGEEVEKRTKNGESQMKATMEVMKKYRSELQGLM